MAVTLNANTSTGFIATSDTSGVLQLQTGGTTAVTVSAAQNVGIGTASPASDARLTLASPTTESYVMFSRTNSTFFDAAVGNNAGSLVFKGGADSATVAGLTEFMRIDSSGNVGIGTASPGRLLSLSAASPILRMTETGANSDLDFIVSTNSGGLNISVDANNEGANSFCAVSVDGTERMRIDSSGQVGVGMAGAATVRLSVASGTSYIMVGRNSAGSTDQFRIEADGDVENVNNVYRAISDVKIKENINDATPKLKKLCQVRVVSYNLKDGLGYGTHKQIGVVAQELEQIFPGMVEESPDYEEVTTTDEDGNETTERVATGTTTKSVKYSVFVPMLIKAIQEQQAIITSLTDRITALEGTTP